ncbi:contact-dependent growth inhibition system immunity protein [Curtobacterium sp. MCPF17_002]|uniref:contact-dependent growth inhibition system immunity protein n=1 Tax=Curtobacterium sp. MCPF17_002 TaxID=2175645 RepID=UPI000DAA41ED|nr:contact-dependent growth inhibition system immunity protein [Curtobacterium sp. MCPF17_002]WIB78202.1 contact-dependent growth inhibition system immunity protein [Curtobacterium sp. MCPF17_002]
MGDTIRADAALLDAVQAGDGATLHTARGAVVSWAALHLLAAHGFRWAPERPDDADRGPGGARLHVDLTIEHEARPDSLRMDMDMDIKFLRAQTPVISSILSGAFHQDWKDDWDSAEDVWRTAIDHAPSQQIPQLDADSALLIEHLHTDADVLRFISVNASGFSPQLDANQEPREWLRMLRARVQARMNRLEGQ